MDFHLRVMTLDDIPAGMRLNKLRDGIRHAVIGKGS